MRDPNLRSMTLARLHAALDSVETTRGLVAEIRDGETFTSERPELRGIVDHVVRAAELLRSIIVGERAAPVEEPGTRAAAF
jgi:hypothetical protein